MAQIDRWVLVQRDGVEQDYEFDNYLEAENEAAYFGYAVIERHYEYTDSELVWTPDGSTSWPPKKRTKEEDEAT